MLFWPPRATAFWFFLLEMHVQVAPAGGLPQSWGCTHDAAASPLPTSPRKDSANGKAAARPSAVHNGRHCLPRGPGVSVGWDLPTASVDWAQKTTVSLHHGQFPHTAKAGRVQLLHYLGPDSLLPALEPQIHVLTQATTHLRYGQWPTWRGGTRAQGSALRNPLPELPGFYPKRISGCLPKTLVEQFLKPHSGYSEIWLPAVR